VGECVARLINLARVHNRCNQRMRKTSECARLVDLARIKSAQVDLAITKARPTLPLSVRGNFFWEKKMGAIDNDFSPATGLTCGHPLGVNSHPVKEQIRFNSAPLKGSRFLLAPIGVLTNVLLRELLLLCQFNYASGIPRPFSKKAFQLAVVPGYLRGGAEKATGFWESRSGKSASGGQ